MSSDPLDHYLEAADDAMTYAEPLKAVAYAVTGLLAGLVDANRRHAEDESFRTLWVSLEQRVRDLAEWHDTKAMKATEYPGGPEQAAVMEKAARVHRDAASRLRCLMDDHDPNPEHENG